MTHSQPLSENELAPTHIANETATESAEAHIDGISVMLGKIPSGLFVVTWREDSHDRGMLASWVMQAGFVPPLITLAVDRTRNLLAAIQRGTPFVVNVLGESQRSLLAKFGRPAGPGDDPFAGLTITHTPTGIAAIAQTTGWLECQCVGQTSVESGDHAVVLARITAAQAGSQAGPLVHLRRNGLRY